MELSRGTMKKLLALVAFGVVLYTALEHLEAAMAALRFVWGVLAPFLVLTLALSVVVVLLLALVVAPQLVESVSGLGNTIVGAARRFIAWAETEFASYPSITGWLEGLTLDWKGLLATTWELLTNGVGSVVTSTISAANSVISALTTGFVSFVFAVYLLLQKERLSLQCRKVLYALLPERTAGQIVEVCSLSHRVFSSFITGQCIEAVILGFMFFVCMTLLKMPYALLVGCLIAVTALIPIVGAFIGCGVGVFLLLMVSPMWVLAAVTLGGSLMGVLGMLLFIPLASVLYTLFRTFIYRRLKEKKIKVI